MENQKFDQRKYGKLREKLSKVGWLNKKGINTVKELTKYLVSCGRKQELHLLIQDVMDIADPAYVVGTTEEKGLAHQLSLAIY